jgi:hypothetical protein
LVQRHASREIIGKLKYNSAYHRGTTNLRLGDYNETDDEEREQENESGELLHKKYILSPGDHTRPWW